MDQLEKSKKAIEKTEELLKEMKATEVKLRVVADIYNIVYSTNKGFKNDKY